MPPLEFNEIRYIAHFPNKLGLFEYINVATLLNIIMDITINRKSGAVMMMPL